MPAYHLTSPWDLARRIAQLRDLPAVAQGRWRLVSAADHARDRPHDEYLAGLLHELVGYGNLDLVHVFRRQVIATASASASASAAAVAGDGGAEPSTTATETSVAPATPGQFLPDTLATAALGGHAEIVRWLLDHADELPASVALPTTIVEAVARRGHAEVLAVLLDRQGADKKHTIITPRALVEAARAGRRQVVELLLTRKRELGIVDEDLVAAAHETADRPLVELLLRHVEDPQRLADATVTLRGPTDNTDTQGAMMATGGDDPAAVAMRVLTDPGLLTVVGGFVEDRRRDLVELREDLARRFDFSVTNFPRYAIVKRDLPLLRAIWANAPTARYHRLPEFSFDDALYDAAGEGNLEILAWLHAQSQPAIICRGDTMAMAVRSGRAEVIRWLATHRPESAESMHESDAALCDAARRGHQEALECCHEFQLGHFTPTIMDIAAIEGHLGIVRFLHERRAEGCTQAAFDGAIQARRTDVVDWLHEHRGFKLTDEIVKQLIYDGDVRGFHCLIRWREDTPNIVPTLREVLPALVEPKPQTAAMLLNGGPEVPTCDDTVRLELFDMMTRGSTSKTLSLLKQAMSGPPVPHAVMFLVIYGGLSPEELTSAVRFACRGHHISNLELLILLNVHQHCDPSVFDMLRDETKAGSFRAESFSGKAILKMLSEKENGLYGGEHGMHRIPGHFTREFLRHVIRSGGEYRMDDQNWCRGVFSEPNHVLSAVEMHQLRQLDDPELTKFLCARSALIVSPEIVAAATTTEDVVLLQFLLDINVSIDKNMVLDDAIQNDRLVVLQWLCRAYQPEQLCLNAFIVKSAMLRTRSNVVDAMAAFFSGDRALASGMQLAMKDAVRQHDLDLVRTLLESPVCQDRVPEGVLVCAVEQRDSGAVKLLAPRSSVDEICRALFVATEAGNLNVLEDILTLCSVHLDAFSITPIQDLAKTKPSAVGLLAQCKRHLEAHEKRMEEDLSAGMMAFGFGSAVPKPSHPRRAGRSGATRPHSSELEERPPPNFWAPKPLEPPAEWLQAFAVPQSDVTSSTTQPGNKSPVFTSARRHTGSRSSTNTRKSSRK